MKSITFFSRLMALIFLQSLSTNTIAQDFHWANIIGGTGYDIGYGMAVDGSGNVYTVGVFNGTIDIDPGPGTTYITSAGNNDIFIQKVSNSGNFIWARQLGGSGADNCASIAIDGIGNVYTTGNFSSTVDFDPGPGTSYLSSAGAVDVFVSKLDANGNYLWAMQLGGTGNDKGNSIALDGYGNLYTTGSFSATADFDPGSGTANLTSAGSDDVFISKLDGNGSYLWARRMGGSGADVGNSLVISNSGKVITVGSFSQTVDFDPGLGVANMVSAGVTDVFISNLDLNGDYIWAKRMGGTASDIGTSVSQDVSGEYIYNRFLLRRMRF